MTEIHKDIFADICKVDETSHTLLGVVLVPEVVDLQGDIVSAEVIEKAAHEFLIWSRETRLQHVAGYVAGLHVVESWIALAATTVEGRKIKKGTWLMKMRVDNEQLWDMVTRGDLTGFSIGGSAQAVVAPAGAAA